MPRPTPRWCAATRSRAFTLIELLTVIAVLAVLSAILSVGIRNALGRADSTKCASNLRQIGMAFFNWGNDNEQKIAPSFYPGDGDAMELRHWTGIVAPYLGWQGENSPTDRWESYMQMPIYVCPEKPDSFGYSYNWAHLTYVQQIAANAARWVSFQDVQAPGKTVLLADSWDPNNPPSWKSILRSPSESNQRSTVHFRHTGNTANVLWLDGHVSTEQQGGDLMRTDNYYFRLAK